MPSPGRPRRVPQPWDRRRHASGGWAEGYKEWKLFEAYLKLPHDVPRTLKAAWEAARQSGMNWPAEISEWAHDEYVCGGWRERARAYDAYMEQRGGEEVMRLSRGEHLRQIPAEWAVVRALQGQVTLFAEKVPTPEDALKVAELQQRVQKLRDTLPCRFGPEDTRRAPDVGGASLDDVRQAAYRNPEIDDLLARLQQIMSGLASGSGEPPAPAQDDDDGSGWIADE